MPGGEAGHEEGEPAIDEADLRELQACLAGTGLEELAQVPAAADEPWPDFAQVPAAAEEPWPDFAQIAKKDGGGAGAGAAAAVATEDLPRPPGFENGPGSEPAGAAGKPAAPPGRTSGLEDDAEAVVVVEPDDPQAEYLAATSWDELKLPRELLDGIFDMGFTKPSKIQEWALPIALRGGNIIGQAKNGSGKTVAFALSMLYSVEPHRRCPQALNVSPTRELAAQNSDVLTRLAKFTDMQFFLAVPQPERPPRRVDAQVVVGTPGKLQDLIKRRVIDPSGFRTFVLDEADVMIDEDNQMGPQVLQVRTMLPRDLQILLFSATWPEHVEIFANRLVPRPNIIKIQKEDLTLSTVAQTFIDVGGDESKKWEKLSDLYGALTIGQSIIFCNTRNGAFDLATRMKAEGHAVSLICGTQQTGPERIDVGYRDRVMGEFRSGATRVLISTDVLSRGIDVPAVTLVVNYELPRQYYASREPDYETYIHRIGRTGRFGLKGIAVNLVLSHERWLLDSIRDYYSCALTELGGDMGTMEGLLRNLR